MDQSSFEHCKIRRSCFCGRTDRVDPFFSDCVDHFEKVKYKSFWNDLLYALCHEYDCHRDRVSLLFNGSTGSSTICWVLSAFHQSTGWIMSIWVWRPWSSLAFGRASPSTLLSCWQECATSTKNTTKSQKCLAPPMARFSENHLPQLILTFAFLLTVNLISALKSILKYMPCLADSQDRPQCNHGSLLYYDKFISPDVRGNGGNRDLVHIIILLVTFIQNKLLKKVGE